MQYNPKDAETSLFKEDEELDFEVKTAYDKTSESGNEYIKMRLKCWDSQGNEGNIFTNLVMPWQVKQFCEATNILDKFESGEIRGDDCLDKKGKIIARIERDKSGQYPDKNGVKKYLPFKPSSVKPELDDDIPF